MSLTRQSQPGVYRSLDIGGGRRLEVLEGEGRASLEGGIQRPRALAGGQDAVDAGTDDSGDRVAD